MDLSLSRDEARDWPGARTIHLGGDEFVVAPLTLRQTIALADVTKRIFSGRESGLIKIGKDDGGEDRAIYGSEMLDNYVDVIRIGLQRVYPGATRDDVLDLTGSVDELVAASMVVMEQAGGKKKDDNNSMGEPRAASDSTSSTG
jgi:hypothetical protein